MYCIKEAGIIKSRIRSKKYPSEIETVHLNISDRKKEL
jgi:hypothetical protein